VVGLPITGSGLSDAMRFGPVWPKEFRGRAWCLAAGANTCVCGHGPRRSRFGGFSVAIPGKEMVRRLKGTRRKVAA